MIVEDLRSELQKLMDRLGDIAVQSYSIKTELTNSPSIEECELKVVWRQKHEDN